MFYELILASSNTSQKGRGKNVQPILYTKMFLNRCFYLCCTADQITCCPCVGCSCSGTGVTIHKSCERVEFSGMVGDVLVRKFKLDPKFNNGDKCGHGSWFI